MNKFGNKWVSCYKLRWIESKRDEVSFGGVASRIVDGYVEEKETNRNQRRF
jgi:hypothetical protein